MNEIRNQFEAWARTFGHDLTRHRIGRDGADSYSDNFALYAWTAWQAALATRQPQGVPDGFVLVPRDPVAALPMLHALADAAGLERLPNPNDEGSYPITGQQSTVRQWYAAMLAAAPSPERQ